MCAVIKEISVPLSDLRRIVITCARCQSDTTFDITLGKQNNTPLGKTSATPEACSVCEAHFDQGAQESIDALREAYSKIGKQKSLSVSFRVPSATLQ